MIYQYKSMKIYYNPHLDGGGIEVYSEFARVIHQEIGKVHTIYEYCAGPGFIGFSLLEEGLCERLVMSDIVSEAIDCCKKTVRENHLEGRVDLYVSDCLKQIPPQKWDLVVANPPHFSTHQSNLPQDDSINVDTGWKIHRDFYSNAREYLTLRGHTLFVENGRGSSPDVFNKMIQEGGLKIRSIIKCNLSRPSQFYFLLTEKDRLCPELTKFQK